MLREVTLATRDLTEGKLGPTWEGPYWVIGSHMLGAYHLETPEGRKLPHLCNAEHLKKFYQ